MKKYEAIGVVEALFMTTAIEILDQMCKASDVEFLTSEKLLGGRLVSVIIGGSVSSVRNALETAERVCASKQSNPLKVAVMISKPHVEIMKFIVPPDKGVQKRPKELEPQEN